MLPPTKLSHFLTNLAFITHELTYASGGARSRRRLGAATNETHTFPHELCIFNSRTHVCVRRSAFSTAPLCCHQLNSHISSRFLRLFLTNSHVRQEERRLNGAFVLPTATSDDGKEVKYSLIKPVSVVCWCVEM